MKTIKGEAVALQQADATGRQEISDFSFVGAYALVDGVLIDSWKSCGYVYAGRATIEIELLPAGEVTAQAVAAIEQQQRKVQAQAQAEVTRLEAQKQSLLALTNEVTA